MCVEYCIMKAIISFFAALAVSVAATGSQASASPMRAPPASPCAAFIVMDPARDGVEYKAPSSHRGGAARLVDELKPEAASVSLASRDASGVVVVRNPFFEALPPAH
jgi:hypothetical protein